MAKAAQEDTIDPGRLQARLDELKAMPSEKFYDDVFTWATEPDPEPMEEAVFGHPDLWRRTKAGLARVINDTQGEMRREPDPVRREELHAEVMMLQDARRRVQERRKVTTYVPEVRPGETISLQLPSRASLSRDEVTRLEELESLSKNDPNGFKEAVFIWATDDGEESEGSLFRQPELAQATVEVLGELIREARLEEEETPEEETKKEIRVEQRLLGSARSELKPFVNLAISQAAKGEDEERAKTYLKELHFKEYRTILAAIKAGKSRKDILEEGKARQA